jgi:LDH2 family malate/lactate/ureidoglycolate dehydrogenase
MEMAIQKAKTTGIGMVVVRNSNHYGIAGYYAKMACDQGLLGLSCTNTNAIMVPTYGRMAMLGTNPIAVAMPAEPYDFFFDAATTVVTRGKLEVYNKKGEPLHDGWALNKDGHPSNDAADVLDNIADHNGGGIMPLGGSTEDTGSHKGYGWAMVCELFSSILAVGTTSDKTGKGGKGGKALFVQGRTDGDGGGYHRQVGAGVQQRRHPFGGGRRYYGNGNRCLSRSDCCDFCLLSDSSIPFMESETVQTAL